MEELKFKPSAPGSMGVELELQLVNTDNYNLAVDAEDLLKRMQEVRHSGDLKPEITKSMVEVNSSVHQRYHPLLAELQALRDQMAEQARKLNVGISGGGTHPFQKWSERRIYPTDRFKNVSETYGYLAKQFTVFGQHIHIGCGNPQDALYLCHAFARYLPQFIALSASSPFYQGADTAFDSSRLSIVKAFPLSGPPPAQVRTWEEFEAYFNKMRALGIVKSMKDFYWDIRPKPEFGTVELRVCDTPLTVDRAAALAAYAQALASYLLNARPALGEDVYLTYSYNYFQACRYGLRGQFIHPADHEHLSLDVDILQTLKAVAPHAERLQSSEALTYIESEVRAARNDAAWLRDTFAQTKSLNDIVREQCVLWMGADA